MARARPIPDLSCDDLLPVAARKVVRVRVEELVGFWGAVHDSSDEPGRQEAVHDMRVASRRLRAALEVFASAFRKRQLKEVLRETKQLARALGDVRDMDVLIETAICDIQGLHADQVAALNILVKQLRIRRTAAEERLTHVLKGAGPGLSVDATQALLALAKG